MDLGSVGTALRRVKVGSLGSLPDVPFNIAALAEAGVVRPVRPDKLVRILRELRRWGASPAAGIAGAAIQNPDRTMVVDEEGEVTFAEMHRRSNALARALAERGAGAGEGVAIMCRNHRRFIDATLAVSKLGATGLYMNTAFSGPQLAGVVEREGPSALIYDEEFAALLDEASEGLQSFIGWREDGSSGDMTIDELIDGADSDADLEPPEESARFVILTSGTTGTPKGAQRGAPDSLAPLAAMFSRIPLKAEETTVIAAPLFHSWGFAHFMLGLSLNSTYVLQGKFDPEATLRAVEEHRGDRAGRGARDDAADPPASRGDARRVRPAEPAGDRRERLGASGAAGREWMDHFGDNLYNLYGSTEVAWATIATPEDLRAAPGTAGKPPRGTVVRIVDSEGESELPTGETGRVFVGNDMAFEGYTGGGGKDEYQGLLSSGDVGHFDDEGRLFIDGRDDEMIVSGGENVFPREVEDLLAGHDAVKEVAVIGVDDEEFGQRLKAFVVLTEDGSVDEDELKGHVKQNLARYKVPREVEFLDSLPRNATGKILKRELA